MMEQYILTQEDIDRLNLTDAIAGDVATEQELRALFPAQMNEQEQLARQAETAAMEFATPQTAAIQTEEMPMSYPNDYSALRDLGLDVAQTQNVLDAIQADQPAPVTVDQSDTSAFQPAFSQMTLEQLGLTQTPPALLDAMQQPAAPEDPYSNLSKTQRRMLAFAAISDAGAALQGMQGRAVRDLMSDFTARADQVRKAKAAQMRQEMLSNLMGAPSGMTGDMNAQKQQIMGALAGGLIDGPTARIMLDQLGEQEQKVSSASKSSALMADIDLLSGLGGLDQLLGVEGIFTRGLESLNLGALRPDAQTARSILNKIKGGVFLAAFETLKGGGQITELEGQKAEQAQARLLETQSPEAFRDALAELRFYADIARRRAMGEYVPPDTIYQSKLGQKEQPTSVDDLTAEEKKRLGLN